MIILVAILGVRYFTNKAYERCDTTTVNPDYTIDSCTVLIKNEQGKAGVYSNRGNAYVQKGLYDLAIQDFNQALTLEPYNAIVLNNRANGYIHMQQFDHAITDADQAVHLKPDFVHAYINRGTAYLGLRQYDKAVENADFVLQHDAKNVNVLVMRGMAYNNTGANDLALQDFEQAIRLAPDVAVSRIARANYYMSQGQFSNAIADLNKAINLGMTNADVYLMLGISEMYNASAEATANLADAVKRDPADPVKVVWLHLARLRFHQDDVQEFSYNSAHAQNTKWPAPIIGLFNENITPEMFMVQAGKANVPEKNGSVCEANFYGGEFYLQKNMVSQARALFQTAEHICPADYTEKIAAHAELGTK